MGRQSIIRYLDLVILFILCGGALHAAPAVNPADTSHPIFQFLPRVSHTINRFPVIYLYIFGGALVLMAVMRLLVPGYLREILISVYDLKILLNSFGENRFGLNFTSFLLDLIAIGIFSIFIHQFFFHGEVAFGWIVAFTAAVYFFKLIIIQFMANVFFGKGEALVHLLLHLLLTRLFAILLMPALFIILYQSALSTSQLLYYIFIASGVIYSGWLIRLFFKMKALTVNGAIYVFLYLCTIEIAPLAIALKDYIR
jgi:hypothetical protein